jgi:hypothetical protein
MELELDSSSSQLGSISARLDSSSARFKLSSISTRLNFSSARFSSAREQPY